MTNYFAHSTENSTKADWQPLEDHLSEVGRRSGEFAGRFHAEDWGRAAGLLHDLGKFSREFQRRLAGGPKVDHATAGGREALERYGPGLGRLLSYAVVGHHSGLPDAGSVAVSASLAGRLTKPNLPQIRDFEAGLKALPELTGVPFQDQLEAPGFSRAFFTRMLYSCLTDADFLDTEGFYDAEKQRGRGEYPALSDLWPCLERYLGAFQDDGRAINRHRADILRGCMAAAEQTAGLFSLTVPTGGGKTLSSLAFALRHALAHGMDRIIYVIPYTSIIEQNAAVFRKALGDLGPLAVVEHHSNYRPPPEDDLESSRQAARMALACENWDAPLIVTTNVQFFESLFANRSSRCRKLHNIARSVVILDEAQMLPVSLLQPCIAVLRELCANYGTTVVLCTATQPALHRSDALPCGFEDAEVREMVPDHAALHQAFRRVDVTYMGSVADSQVVERIDREAQALCIVNTRGHARKLFEALGEGDGNFHLSALMCPAHRTEILAQVRARLAAGAACRVVSTQLIEAGVDVDFPVVLRAASGVDSVAQAAGRCNREGRLPNRGQVLVFDPECGLPPGHFRRVAQVGAMIARTHAADILAPEAVHEYFSELYFFEGADGLDREGILSLLREGAPTLSFPFREIAEKFRIIARGMETLIVPYRPPGIPAKHSEVDALIKQLRYAGLSAKLARQLQQYTVQVWPYTLAGLRAAGVVEEVADAFYLLTNEPIYRSDLGLCPEDPTFRNQEDNVF